MVCWLLVGIFVVSSWLYVWVVVDRMQERFEAEEALANRLVDLVAVLHRKRVLTAEESHLLGWALEESRR